MERLLRRLFALLRQLRWKLTLSYTVVTVAALLVIELIVIFGLASYVADRSQITPEDLIDSINAAQVPLARRFLSKNPPDIVGLQQYLGDRDEVVIDVEPIRLGDFVFEVSSPNILYIFFINSDGTLIDSLPHNFLEQTQNGDLLDVSEIQGLTSPLQASLNGIVNPDFQSVTMSSNTIVGAVPVIDPKDDDRTLGAIAFMHTFEFWQVVTLATLAKQLGIGLLFITLFAGALGMAFGSWTAAGLVRRLKNVNVSTEAWSKGNFSSYVDDPTGDELGQLAQRLNQMAAKLENLLEERREVSVIEERNRLARELHDSVKQQTFAASAQLGAARALFKPDPIKAEIHIAEADKLLNEARQELTDLIQELRPVALQGKGLATAVREYASDCSNQNNLEVDVFIRGERRLPLQIEQSLFRIVQGALSNIVRHSDADQAEVQVIFDPTAVTLMISDNGIGFDTALKHNGMGIRSIQERVELINGSFRIESTIGEGTQITIKCIA
jgi:NarL family two-component system sensor histidine kinase LiaS